MKSRTVRSVILLSALLLISSWKVSASSSDGPYFSNYLIPENQSGFEAENYEAASSKKLLRGAENFFFGWLEVPQGIKSEVAYRRQGFLPVGIETVVLGAAKGIGRGFKRMGVGFYEGITFIYPQEPILPEIKDMIY